MITTRGMRRERTGKLRGARLESLPTTAPLIMLLARATTPEPFAAADSHTYTSKASSEGTAPRAKPSSTVGAERFLSSSRYYMKAVR